MKGLEPDFIIATLGKKREKKEERERGRRKGKGRDGMRKRVREIGRWRQMYVKTRGLYSELYQLQISN